MANWTAVERCRKPSGFGRRHLLAILGFAGFALSYAMRFSLSIAIVAMVNNSGALGKIRNVNSTTSSSTVEFPHNDTLQRNSVLFQSDICPHDTTPHATLDLKLNLYHIQTTFIDKKSSNNINNKNSNPFEVGSSTKNSTQLSTLPTTTSTANNDNEGVAVRNKHIAEKTIESPLIVASSLIAQADATNFDGHVEDNDQQNEFNWNEKEQGVILGSFFWGYVLTQWFGGWLSQKIGGKWPFGIGILMTGVFAIVTPAAARLGGMPAVIVVRVIQGLAGGVTVPSMQAILSKWFPPEERGKLGSFTLAGMPFGTFLSTLCSGFLINYFGWSSVFYVTGVLAIVWFVLWSCFAFANPIDDPTIGQAELHYIQAALQQHGLEKSNKTVGGCAHIQQNRKKVIVPWSRVLLSFPFWAILICNTCETWGLYTINAELPTYMKTVLHFDIKQNSVMSAFPHLLTLLVSIILTNVGDTLIEHQYLSIGAVRKLSTSIALWGSAAALFGVAYSGCDRVKTVALLAAAIGANGGKFGGFLVNIIDIAPNYSGILMGLINTVASMPGFFAPWVAGMIINDNPSLENWRLVFLITASISFFGNLVFILCASGEEQSWNLKGGVGDDCSSCSTDKTLQSSASPLECFNQVTLSNNATKHNNKWDCADNGVYIIPLNPLIQVIQQEEYPPHHHRDEGLLPPPLIAIRNVHQDEQSREEKDGLRCSA